MCSDYFHYLNQWCIIVNETLINKLQSNCIPNSNIFIQENAFENIVWKMSAIMSRPRSANLTHLRRDAKPNGLFTVQGVLDGSPSRDAGFRLFGWLDGISSTLPYYHSPKHTFQSVNFPTKYGGFFDIFPSICGRYSHPIHMLKSLKKLKN